MNISKNHQLYWGTINHRRHVPFKRFFSYPIFMAYIDITSLQTTMKPSFLWNVNKPALASFRRQDYHGDPSVSLDSAVRKTLKDKTGKTETDIIKLMRKTLRPGSFRLWRKRVHNTSIKHRKKFKLQRKKMREKIRITDI